MRLSPEQIAQNRQSATETFGTEARVWLFGSRVDDRLPTKRIVLCARCVPSPDKTASKNKP